jgi:glycosyltransferase involved in cell wall biosynthesis
MGCERHPSDPDTPRPAVSLVICTRNRARQLEDCLQYVSRLQPTCLWELIVVDNGSNDETAVVLAEYMASVPFAGKVIFEPVAGLGRARNAGWIAARGEIIAFTDDDCYVTPDYIDRVCEIFIDPKIGFAGGRVDLFDPSDAPMTIKTSDQSELAPPRSYISNMLIVGANMVFRRRVLEQIGGFDPELGPGARFYGEDLDAEARASLAGWWGLYTPIAVIKHHHRRKTADIPALSQAYSVGLGAYKAKLALSPEGRRVVLPMILRHWYWWGRQMPRDRSARFAFMWDLEGFVRYFGHRLRRRLTAKS